MRSALALAFALLACDSAEPLDPRDAGIGDAGIGTDAGVTDAGYTDAGILDGGADAGLPEPDAGVVDAGPICVGEYEPLEVPCEPDADFCDRSGDVNAPRRTSDVISGWSRIDGDHLVVDLRFLYPVFAGRADIWLWFGVQTDGDDPTLLNSPCQGAVGWESAQWISTLRSDGLYVPTSVVAALDDTPPIEQLGLDPCDIFEIDESRHILRSKIPTFDPGNITEYYFNLGAIPCEEPDDLTPLVPGGGEPDGAVFTPICELDCPSL